MGEIALELLRLYPTIDCCRVFEVWILGLLLSEAQLLTMAEPTASVAQAAKSLLLSSDWFDIMCIFAFSWPLSLRW